MLNLQIGQIEKLIIHHIGNKNSEVGVKLSETLSDFSSIENHIINLIVSNFQFDEIHKFYFSSDISLNPVFKFSSNIFNNDNFVQESKNIANYMYDKSIHPKIKGGELFIFLIKNCLLNGESINMMGMFKCEQKDLFIKISPDANNYRLNSEEGMSVKKLDKGCLIFDIKQEDGYLVSITDNTNNIEAQYWKDEFLHLKSVNNEYNQTNRFLTITKNFINERLNDKVSKSEKIDFLNRTIEYFKQNESFEKVLFENKILKDRNLIDSFQEFSENLQFKNEIELSDSFQISHKAVKKQNRAYKRILKLDENFDILIKNHKELIENGIEADGRKFYKIYYQNEK